MFLMRYLQVPIHLIYRLEKKVFDGRFFALEFYMKDKREFKLHFVREEDLTDLASTLEPLLFPVSIMLPTLFLITHAEAVKDMTWKEWDPLAEFTRQGVCIGEHYRVFLNDNYQTCQSYPLLHILPATVTDAHLSQVSRFRTKGRFPSLTFFDQATGCSLWRSSQTMTGIMTARNVDDEKMLSEIGKLSPN